MRREAERSLGLVHPNEGDARVTLDDGIIRGTTAEKKQDMDEATAALMTGWEYRVKLNGEDEDVARSCADGHHAGGGPTPR